MRRLLARIAPLFFWLISLIIWLSLCDLATRAGLGG